MTASTLISLEDLVKKLAQAATSDDLGALAQEFAEALTSILAQRDHAVKLLEPFAVADELGWLDDYSRTSIDIRHFRAAHAFIQSLKGTETSDATKLQGEG